MFKPKTEKIKEITKEKQEVITQLESIFNTKTRVYIDYANVRPWSNRLGWHIELKRLKQFLDSFDTEFLAICMLIIERVLLSIETSMKLPFPLFSRVTYEWPKPVSSLYRAGRSGEGGSVLQRRDGLAYPEGIG